MRKGNWYSISKRCEEQIKSLYRNGNRTNEIADKLHVTENIVVLVLEKAGMI